MAPPKSMDKERKNKRLQGNKTGKKRKEKEELGDYARNTSEKETEKVEEEDGVHVTDREQHEHEEGRRPGERLDPFDRLLEGEGDELDDEQTGSHTSPMGGGFLSMEIERRIATFYEEHPMYYDLAHPDYKNRQKRDAALKCFGESVGLTRK